MKLIFYCNDPNDFCAGLLDQIGSLVPAKRLEVYRNFEELKSSLLKSAYDLFAAVLVVSSRHDLLDLLSIREFLTSIRVILVLPDCERETVSKGHDLRPRFLTWPPWDPCEVIAVLRMMLSSVEKCQRI
ncbi:MAG: hypothetical protein WAN11_08450 [Syntrophobacteraceae bacterium]